jgi:hypothetical protein
MAGLRELIRTGILEILSDGQPRKARELTGALKEYLGRSDVDKRDVNSVLYHELTDSVACDPNFNWRIRRKEQAKGPFTDTELAGEKPLDNSERAGLIRTIYRLRSGLPPNESLEELTVGQGRLVPKLRSLFPARANGEGSWAIARGDYGQGKSHVLQLFNELALSEGFAVCTLSCDGFNNALNHPQRFLPSLLSTLEIPMRQTYGYTDLLYDVLSDGQLSVRLHELTDLYLDNWSTLALEVRDCLDRIIQIIGQGSRNHSELWAECVRFVTYHLTGESIRHLPASPSNRNTSYMLLALARDLLVELGTKGLAITLDEIESIYTKLPNVKSRQGALRVLSFLCLLKNCRVVVAMTPDAYRDLVGDLQHMLIDTQCLPGEDIESWAKTLKTGTVPIVDLRPLNGTDRRQLLERMLELYGRAYGYKASSAEFKESWERCVAQCVQPSLPVRLIIRRAIELMDSNRYRRLLT